MFLCEITILKDEIEENKNKFKCLTIFKLFVADKRQYGSILSRFARSFINSLTENDIIGENAFFLSSIVDLDKLTTEEIVANMQSLCYSLSQDQADEFIADYFSKIGISADSLNSQNKGILIPQFLINEHGTNTLSNDIIIETENNGDCA